MWLDSGGHQSFGLPIDVKVEFLAEFGFALWANKGRRPPVRRNASAAGPPWLEACTHSITV